MGTNIPTVHPTADPTVEPTTAQPTKNPAKAPSKNPTSNPTLGPTLFPSVNPTGSPTSDPSWEPTLEPTVYPTVIPTLVPTTEPTWNITLRRRLLSDDANVYDLDLVFSVQVQNKKESDTLWNVVKAVTFFDNYKNALKESLTLEWVTENYASDLIVVFEQDIESMAVDETQDGGNVDILSPTYSPHRIRLMIMRKE